ncbi:MAG: alpha/beta hydrolase [Candidatus Limnocylindria bacterium]
MPGLFSSLQRSFIYFPLSQQPPPVASALPGAEEVRFTTADGLELSGWYRAAPPGGATVLVMNGNAGDRSHRAPLATALATEGLGVLLFDYRGYAGQAGTPSEDGLLADARAALDLLVASGADPGRIAYFGESLGAAVAIQLAVERAPLALILRSPFTSLEDMARLHYPWLPVGPLLVERYDSIARIGEVRSPVLVLAGSADRIIPMVHSRRLYEAAGEPKRFVEIAGADHNDLALLAGPELVNAVSGFVAEALPGGS